MSTLSFIGAVAVMTFAVTGAYIWLRWGYIGVLAIWSIRKTLDVQVCEAVKDAVVKVGE